ncbi:MULTISPECIES: hypothetical protein [Streptomyces]|uniref:Uncharacterized protein n=2 Tax=Streptomyces TaxID=1883 RepID=A0A3R7HG17_9ACTN|nr:MULTISPECIES: hypothetical protein [Streptomyces]MZE76948.1 hypothetical protein [Streptomyces sp. SID5475]KNE84257.1 hypothetical protein ADZ36_00635 [Streptomyces fradiae]OFA58517.1 hypothetical protein BEN35_03500 [Streptomyces fradiae]PQM22108.1 hypothetical protein Sfr7A_17800 [Streptomyces xinghaiensis]RKM95358.1 hypothetical protein SFRA_014925 [Streptomyces xinghaiensis]
MSFDEEWAELRAAAAERSAMRINSVPDEGSGGGAPDLVVTRADLNRIGEDAHELRGRLSKQGDHARPSTFDAAIALTNGEFVSGSALLKVHDRWSIHLKTLLDACGQIANHLDFTKAVHSKDDVRVEGAMAPVSKLTEYLK